MDLGKTKLLRTGINTLQQAIHPLHGLAWTDGRQVCLTSLTQSAGEQQFGDTNVIGQFEHVLALYWGPVCCPGSPALLAVQHKKHVTVWQLQLSSSEQNKLLCSQTCETSEPFPLLSQGCVWHPRMDVLAVLTKRDASVLFSVRADNRRVKADIKGGGLIHCACWTRDGARLVLSIGSALHSYIWNDVQKTLVPCAFCPIFDVGGYICAIEAVDEAQVAVATELPLDKICGLNAGMSFDLPVGTDPPRSPVLVLGDDGGTDRRFSCSSSPSGPVDLTNLLAKHRKSDPSPLIHLRRRDTLTGSGQDSSHLILVRYERKVTTTRKVNIPGILVPDIIVFSPRGGMVAVASNTCNMVLVYCVTSSNIPNIQQVQLAKDERPKGVCFLSDTRLLLMVGRHKSNDPAFLPSSNTEKYNIRLMIKDLTYESGGAPKLEPSRRSSENFSKDDPVGIKELLLPGNSLIPSPNPRRKLVEEVKSPESSPVSSFTDFSEKPVIENLELEPVNRAPSMASSFSSSPRPDGPNNPRNREKNLEQLTQNMERIFARFAEVQQALIEFRDFTQNGKKLMGSYPAASEPSYINVTYQKQLSENVFIDERRPVLLCDGKLSLRVLQDLFGLPVVEMLHGPLWVVLVSDPDGFVPLTFKHQDELTIRNGRKKSALRPPAATEAFRTESPDV